MNKTRVMEFSVSEKPDSDTVELWVLVDMKDADVYEGNEEKIMNDRVTLTNGGFHYSLTNIKFKKYYPDYFPHRINMVFTASYKKMEMVYPFGYNPITDEIQPKFNI